MTDYKPRRPRPRSQSIEPTSDALQSISTRHSAWRAGVLIDRDGTLNVERGYLHDPAEVKLLPTAGKALALLNSAFIPVVVVTNQSGIGRGVITLTEFEAVNQALWNRLQPFAAYYDALYYCPHDPAAEPPCSCRKPRSGMLLQAAADLELDLAHSYVIGDKRSDIEAGVAAGTRTVLVLTGFGRTSRTELLSRQLQPDYVAYDLLDACRWVLNHLNMSAGA